MLILWQYKYIILMGLNMNNEMDNKQGKRPSIYEIRCEKEKKKAKDTVRRKYFGALRELRTEVQDLRDLLTRIKEGKTSTKDNADYFKKTYSDIQELIKELTGINQDRRSDTCRRIFNSWEKMQANASLQHPEQDRETQDKLHDIAILDEEAGKIILYVGHITIPPRLNRWIGASRAGHYLPFHLLFEDELPTAADRAKVLNAIAWAPDVIKSALVYPSSGLIYCYEQDFIKRLWSLIQVTLIFVLMTVCIWELCFIGQTFNISGWFLEPKYAPVLTIGWLALLVGVVIHTGVESVKHSQSSGLPQVIAINDWLKHISARKGDIILKLLVALFGLFALVVTADISKFTIASAFLVGYSLDSFVGLFGTSIEQKAAAQATVLKEKLGIKSSE
jgi:ribosome assembly protein YihI (activator of Der GTPase)